VKEAVDGWVDVIAGQRVFRGNLEETGLENKKTD
jgi:hypothetical protein